MAQPLRQREARRAAGDPDEPRGGRGARAPGLGPRDAGASPESRTPNPEPRPHPHHRSCGASRPEHDGLAVRAYCDVVPRGCGRHARRAPQGAERRARRERQEDLVHASDRVRDRAGGEAAPRHDARVPGGRGEAAPPRPAGRELGARSGRRGMDFAAFHATYETLVDKARTNKLLPDDFAGATITLTNPGTIGTVASVPRLMKGQGSIIATGAIRQIAGAKVMTITSTYDHRIIQGAESGNFLRRLDGLLQGDDNFYGAVFESLGITGLGARDSGIGTATALALPSPEPLAPSPDLKHVAAAMALVTAIRNFGHLAARLDPLGSEPPGDPALEIGRASCRERV